ncbi:MAG: HEPN domain-containing protein [Arcicella sp.]|jgi:uncharacterized protein (UPF0332 family)|nr:HEPN domain-containing protein [Arcicella sp.]
MNEDIKNGLAIALDTFDDAKFLAQNERYRGAMNRCYYAYYYLVKEILVTKGIIAKTHKGLNSEFGRVLIKTKEIPLKYGEYLGYLFKERQAADYEPEEEIGQEEVDKALQMVEEFINYIKETYQ